MALYDGVPSIRLEGDKARALAYIPEAKALLYKLQGVMKASGANTFSMARPIGEEGYIHALSAAGQNIIHISMSPGIPDVEEPVLDVQESELDLDFLSGVVLRGYLEPSDIDPERQTLRLFAPTRDCAEVQELDRGRQLNGRLAVSPEPTFTELNNQSETDQLVFSQYTKLRPSMYSGLMSKVVQVVMGLGHLSKAKLRRPPEAPVSLAYNQYAREVAASGVQVRYDYKFYRTHGVTIADDGRFWLIEISNFRGVLARPLPIFYGSDTEAYLEAARDRGDESMVYALETLGCLPTGESFPRTTEQLNQFLEAGTILRLMSSADLSAFYTCTPYSSSMGWAFSPTGREAHNTAYYLDENSFCHGVWYQINIRIGALITDRERGDPIATASANLVRISDGVICTQYRGPVLKTYIPIKFHEPYVDGLVSFDAGSLGSTIPASDTTMFVAFDGNNLRAVKYYNMNVVRDVNETEDSRYPGECLYAGEWRIVTRYGERKIPAMMYTSEFDDRAETQETLTDTKITSEDRGFMGPFYTDFILCQQVSKVTRNKLFKYTEETHTSGGAVRGAVVVIPEFSREGYYYAEGSAYEGGYTITKSVSYPTLRDPNVGYGWRYFPGTFPAAACLPFDCAFTACGGTTEIFFPGVTHPHAERRVVCLKHEPYECSDFADSGAWLSQCDNIEAFASPVAPPTPPPSSNTQDLGTNPKATLKVSTPGYGAPWSLPLTFSEYYDLWERPSPDPETGKFQRLSLTYSTIGVDGIVGSTNFFGYGGKRTLGYTPVEVTANDPFPCFIGVNLP